MSTPKIEIDNLSIVLLGSFNPSIFNPQWLLAQELISLTDTKEPNCKINLISPQVSSFELSWCSMTITQERFQATTSKSPFYELLRDLVVGTFRILQHTPINQMGINWDRHYKLTTEEQWHGLGHILAPKEPWKGLLEQPGLSALRMEGKRTDGKNGRICVLIEPSRKITPNGVFIEVNDHFDYKSETLSNGCKGIIDVLVDSWSTSIKTRDFIMNGIIR